MSWIGSSPSILTPVPGDEEVLKVRIIDNTPLFCLLTRSIVFILHRETLLPVAYHQRDEASIEQYGFNYNVKVRFNTVNAAQLKQFATVNLFLQTDKSFLMIYLSRIQYSHSEYEVFNKQDDHLLQEIMPLTSEKYGFSLINFIKNATKSIINGGTNCISLENIEHYNNSMLEDENERNGIPEVTLSVQKILKVGIGVTKYWLKLNSHNLLVYNEKNGKREEVSEDITNMENILQVVNLKTSRNQVLEFSKFEWYPSATRIKCIDFCSYGNYFLFINDSSEIWFMSLDLNESSDIVSNGRFLFKLDSSTSSYYQFAFNPQCDLFLLQVDESLLSFYLDITKESVNLRQIKKINLPEYGKLANVHWASSGEFFIYSNAQTGNWFLCSKFGNISFSSSQCLAETKAKSNKEETLDFLCAKDVIPYPNCSKCLIMNKETNRLFLVSLLLKVKERYMTGEDKCPLFYDCEYLNVISEYSPESHYNFLRFPIPQSFKLLLRAMSKYNGRKSLQENKLGEFVVKMNRYHQFSMSYGDHLAVSTPYSNGHDVNQVLWLHFKNHFIQNFNIMNHFWIDDLLVLFNRTTSVDDKIVDEIIFLDTVFTKYAHGGTRVVFDTDSIIWRYSFENQLLCHDLIDMNDENGISETSDHNLVIFSNESQFLVINVKKVSPYGALSDGLLNLLTVAEWENSEENDKAGSLARRSIRIQLKRNMRFQNFRNTFDFTDITQMQMILNKHFLMLRSNGDLYFLVNMVKSQDGDLTTTPHNNNTFKLIRIQESIESFQIFTLNYGRSKIIYLQVFAGDELLLFDINEITKIYACEDVPKVEPRTQLTPIVIETLNISPILIKCAPLEESSSIELIELESVFFLKKSHLVLANKPKSKIVLNDFLEHDLLLNIPVADLYTKYKNFSTLPYCLELLIYKYFSEKMGTLLNKTIDLVNLSPKKDLIYVSFLRKIELGYWETFFNSMGTTPSEYMLRLIKSQDAQICYTYLLVYLNFKREDEERKTNQPLHEQDTDVIMKIVEMLLRSKKWDLCFELCRYIKLLDPSNVVLRKIKEKLTQIVY